MCSESLTEKGVMQLKSAWMSQGYMHTGPGIVVSEDEEPPKTHTFRRKLKSYAPSKEEREAFLPPWVVENEAAGSKKKGGGKKAKGGGGKKKK